MSGKHLSTANDATVSAMRELGLGYIIATQLPETIAEGVILLYKGDLWRGLIAGESTLPAGTPWPVKGYKELKFAIRQNGESNPVIHISVDNFNLITPLPCVRDGIGTYAIDVTGLNMEPPYIYWNTIVSQSVFDEWQGSQKFIGAYFEPQTHNLRIFTYYQDGLVDGGMADSILRDDLGLFISVQQFLPQTFNPGTFPPGPI